MKRVFIVHRWSGIPKGDWYPWLASQLEFKGYDVHVPVMPHPDEPTIDEWTMFLAHAVGTLDKDTYFIGHSIGCQTILRYLEAQKTECGGALFVAGWFTLQGLETDDEQRIAAPWLETPLDFDKIRKNLPHSTALFSDNDPFAPLSDKEIFRAKLNTQIIVEHDKGHFTEGDGITEHPKALDALLRLMQHG